jgi:membrane associated rhomboid family serine protease
MDAEGSRERGGFLTGRWSQLAVRLLAKAIGAVLIYIGASIASSVLSVTGSVGVAVQALAFFVGVLLVIGGVMALLS